jgi:hypothetical protein
MPRKRGVHADTVLQKRHGLGEDRVDQNEDATTAQPAFDRLTSDACHPVDQRPAVLHRPAIC